MHANTAQAFPSHGCALQPCLLASDAVSIPESWRVVLLASGLSSFTFFGTSGTLSLTADTPCSRHFIELLKVCLLLRAGITDGTSVPFWSATTFGKGVLKQLCKHSRLYSREIVHQHCAVKVGVIDVIAACKAVELPPPGVASCDMTCIKDAQT